MHFYGKEADHKSAVYRIVIQYAIPYTIPVSRRRGEEVVMYRERNGMSFVANGMVHRIVSYRIKDIGHTGTGTRINSRGTKVPYYGTVQVRFISQECVFGDYGNTIYAYVPIVSQELLPSTSTSVS